MPEEPIDSGGLPGSAGAGTAPSELASTPGDGSSAGPAATSPVSPTQAAGDSGYVGIRDALASYGIDLRKHFPDDEGALAHLVAAYRQAEQSRELSRYGEIYLRHADAFQRYLAQQQQQQAPAARAESWWTAPEYDPRWQSQVSRDLNTGEVRALPGTDPTVVQRYLKWAEHQKSFLDRFSRDPIDAIRPGLEGLIREVSDGLIQERMAAQREQGEAASFVSENSFWLHSRDAKGNVLKDPLTGTPVLSEWGQVFKNYVDQAVARGYRDVQSQRDYAMALVERDYLLAKAKEGAAPAEPAADANSAAKNQFLKAAAAARTANASGAANGPGPGKGQPGHRSLREQLRKRLEEKGFRPSDVLPGP